MKPDGMQDALVVGAGLVGGTTALGLARAGYHVGLIEQSLPRINAGASGHDPRTVAISPHSQELLETLGLWQDFVSQAFERIVVWEDQGTAKIEFTASEVGIDALGWIIELSPAGRQLWNALEAEPNVQLYAGSRVTSVHSGESEVGLGVGTGSDGVKLRGRLLIAADGAQSGVGELLGLETDGSGTGHSAIASIVKVSEVHCRTAFQRFLLDGPVALLPIAGDQHHFSLVWSQPPEQAERRMALADADFCKELQQAVENVPGEILMVDRRYCFPLNQSLRASFHPCDRVVFIGDSAHVIHPLAGQGVNLGFEDVRELLEVADSARTDLGQSGIWPGYARRRRLRAQFLQTAMTGFQDVYAQDNPLLQWLRNMGVQTLNASPTIKRQVMKEALGLGAFN